ncbi:MAG TPA: zf-HC2 domain-containing protein, partial [Candidatus Acidoferrum sp.]|nr:zf-HC2 domain-containing protein [Candidatus Acidoferrum sp.]
ALSQLPVGGIWRKLGELSMSCRDTIHLICMYLEGKLSPGVQGEIEHHLQDCSDCRLVLDAATTTLDRYFGLPKPVSDSQAA